MKKSQQHNKKKINCKSVYNEKYLKPKIKSDNARTNTSFYNNKIPKEGSQIISLSIILIDSVYRKGKNFNPEAFLKECRYVAKEKKTSKFFIDNIEISSDDSDKEDEEDSDE